MTNNDKWYGHAPLITQAYVDRLEANPNLGRLFRTDDFKQSHPNGKHILFAGCSFTWGEGLEMEDSWAYKTYKKIAEKYPVDGFYNVGRIGWSIGESIHHIFMYIREFGNPEAIFLFMPDHGRDMKYVADRKEALDSYVYSYYLHLDTYCKSHNIKLITSTWAEDINGKGDHILPGKDKKLFYPNSTLERPHWAHQLGGSPTPLLKEFQSYHQVDKQTLIKRVFEIDSAKKGADKTYSLIAADKGAHPGTSFHDYWAEFMFDIWQSQEPSPE